MYGTAMIGRLTVPFEQVQDVSRQWEKDKGARTPGYVNQSVLLSDDESTVVVAVRFTDRESYMALADDPEQDTWWQERMAPCLDGEVQWIDGTWHD